MSAIKAAAFVLVGNFARFSTGYQVPRQRPTLVESDVEIDRDDVCLGSMCGIRGPEFMLQGRGKAFTTATEYEMRGRRPFCPHNRSSASRLLILPLVAHNHGSSALASVLMSSKEVATLCSANTWQCDGLGLVINREDESANNDWLARFSRYWNLQRHVLLAPHPDIKTETFAFQSELENGPPDAMKKAGIKHVKVSYLIMWRPVCMGILSGSTHNKSVEYAREELMIMEYQAAAHKQMLAANQAALVVSLADILWAPTWSKSRMEKMIPCIGQLDFDAIPELNKDHFPENELKFGTSVLKYGYANPPSACDYDMTKRQCGPAHNAFGRLTEEEQKRARKVVRYLEQWSQ